MSNTAESIEERKERIEFKNQTRDFVFGLQDGLISILGLITGVYGAYRDQPTVVVITGITGAIAAALSMASGSLLSAKAEQDILLKEIDTARDNFMGGKKEIAKQSLSTQLTKKGLEQRKAQQVVELLSEEEETLFSNFRSLVLDLPRVEEKNPYLNSVVMFIAFIIGALVPILPFVISEGQPAFISALVLTGIALFGIGAMKGRFGRGSVLKSGLKFFVIAVSAGILSELIGSAVNLIIQG